MVLAIRNPQKGVECAPLAHLQFEHANLLLVQTFQMMSQYICLRFPCRNALWHVNSTSQVPGTETDMHGAGRRR